MAVCGFSCKITSVGSLRKWSWDYILQVSCDGILCCDCTPRCGATSCSMA